jgi:hypothetical protein
MLIRNNRKNTRQRITSGTYKIYAVQEAIVLFLKGKEPFSVTSAKKRRNKGGGVMWDL